MLKVSDGHCHKTQMQIQQNREKGRDKKIDDMQ